MTEFVRRYVIHKEDRVELMDKIHLNREVLGLNHMFVFYDDDTCTTIVCYEYCLRGNYTQDECNERLKNIESIEIDKCKYIMEMILGNGHKCINSISNGNEISKSQDKNEILELELE